jgi:ABC-type branched-subunit amino acid transport system ATPase component
VNASQCDGGTGASTVLSVRDLRVSYDGVKAVDGVSFDVMPGEIFGLIGPNGAGKTTLLDALSGFVPASGTVMLGGEDISRAPTHVRARLGIGRTFQSVELFETLTVGDNLRVAAQRRNWWQSVRDLFWQARDSADKAVASGLAVVGLGHLANASIDMLSHGQRKLVGVGRALSSGGRVILLDEPAAGLNTAETSQLGAHLRELPLRGISVVLVDHDMGLVLDVCDRILVMDFGRELSTGPPAHIRSDPKVLRAYLGKSAGTAG